MSLATVSTAACVVLLSAYVSYVAVEPRDTAASWSFLLSALALSAARVVPVVWPLRLSDAWKTTSLLQHTAGIVIAFVARDLPAYCVAFAFAFFFTSVVTLAHDRSLVHYNAGVGFSVSSAATYGFLRVVSRVVVRETDVGLWFSHLLPFLASSLETLGMYASGDNGYYAFASHSYLFSVYALLKASLFLALPRVEDYLMDRA